jgi:hypothetical protein
MKGSEILPLTHSVKAIRAICGFDRSLVMPPDKCNRKLYLLRFSISCYRHIVVIDASLPPSDKNMKP